MKQKKKRNKMKTEQQSKVRIRTFLRILEAKK